MPKKNSKCVIAECEARLRSLGFELRPSRDEWLAQNGVAEWVHIKSGKVLQDFYQDIPRKPGQSTAEHVVDIWLASANRLLKNSMLNLFW